MIEFGYIYLLLHGREIVYVGRTLDPKARIRVHRSSKVFDQTIVIPVANSVVMERDLIQAINPSLNRIGTMPEGADKLIRKQRAVDAAIAARDAAILDAVDAGFSFYAVHKAMTVGYGRQVMTQPTVKAIYRRTKERAV